MSTWGPARNAKPVPVGDVLADFLRASGLREKLRSPEIYDCWPEVAGPEAARHSRVVGLSNCTLHVEVDSAPWLHMLSTFRKPDLLRGLAQVTHAVRIKDIQFKIGTAADPSAAPGTRQCLSRTKHKTTSSRIPPTTPGTSRSSRG